MMHRHRSRRRPARQAPRQETSTKHKVATPKYNNILCIIVQGQYIDSLLYFLLQMQPAAISTSFGPPKSYRISDKRRLHDGDENDDDDAGSLSPSLPAFTQH